MFNIDVTKITLNLGESVEGLYYLFFKLLTETSGGDDL